MKKRPVGAPIKRVRQAKARQKKLEDQALSRLHVPCYRLNVVDQAPPAAGVRASSTEYFDQVLEVSGSSVEEAGTSARLVLAALSGCAARGFGSCTVIIGLRRP